MRAVAVETAGWGGPLLVLAAYTVLSTGRLASASHGYQAMNILGAIGMAVNGWRHSHAVSVQQHGSMGIVRVAIRWLTPS